jgi:hypothetical protein
MECQLCVKHFSTITSFVEHLVLHSQAANTSLDCTICNKQLFTVSALKSHVLREHSASTKKQTKCVSYDAEIPLRCGQSACGAKSNNMQQFLSHLRDHIDEGDEILCPFTNCNRKYSNKHSFATHLSREHRKRAASDVSPSFMENRDYDFNNAVQSTNVTDSNTQFESLCDTDESSTVMDLECAEFDETSYVKTLALFYMKLQCIYFIPSSTVDLIIKEINDITRYGSIQIFKKIIAKVRSQLSAEACNCLINELSVIDLYQSTRSGCLRTDYMRKEWIRRNLKYCAPVSIPLGHLVNKKGKQKHFYYIPIMQSLQNLFSDKSVIKDYRASLRVNHPENELHDITDGSVFKHNTLFSSHPEALRIILYTDSFEVVNPLGSAKCRHKIFAVYFTLANFLPHNRSSVNHIQLLLLCHEKDFELCGQEIVFSRLVSDLQILENDGIQLFDEQRVQGAVVAIAGDNLGSHLLGGFVKNFSMAEHFCRYCEISKTVFKSDISCGLGQRRTPETYSIAANQIVENSPVCGIVHLSYFNRLNYFNVCSPGLPPCIAHDLFEGIVAYDIKLCIDYFVKKKKLFSYATLNHFITTFKYKETDARNVPCAVNPKADKLNGSAAQNWNFIRFLPLWIFKKIDSFEDSSWQLILLLREIIEIVCTPKLSLQRVAILEYLIDEYMQLRIECFPDTPLRPKHHYVRHYAQLTLSFGPLVHLWTLRFESKHSYFKKIIRNTHNFINVCSTLAEQHQLLQAVLSAGHMFKPNVQVQDSICFCPDLYNEEIQRAVINQDFTPENSIVSQEILYHGTVYKKALCIPINKTDSEIILGEILLVVVKNHDEVYFVVRKMVCTYVGHLHVYQSESTKNESIMCVAANDLIDYYPLNGYLVDGNMYFVLKHYL